ncbi:tetraspanin-33-like isoform X2 [Amblyomma americanum]
MSAGDCSEVQLMRASQGELQPLVTSGHLYRGRKLTWLVHFPPLHHFSPREAAQYPEWATFRSYPHPPRYAKAADYALSSPAQTARKRQQASTRSPKSSPMSGQLKEISTTTVYDVSAIYLLPLCVCNFLLIVGSAVAFLASLYATFGKDETEVPSSARSSLLATLLLHLETVLMVVSGSLFITGTVGLLGALRQNICLLKAYTIVMTGIAALALFAALLVAAIPFMARSILTTHVTEDFVVHYRDKADYHQASVRYPLRVIDYLQKTLQCCGMSTDGYRDWDANPYFACNKSNPSAERCSVPYSCCRAYTSNQAQESVSKYGTKEPSGPLLAHSRLCGRGVLQMAERDAWQVIYLRGCADAMFQTLRAHNFEILAALILLTLFILLLSSLAGSVRSQIKALTKIYDKYYKTVYRGQQSMRRAHERVQRRATAKRAGVVPLPRSATPASAGDIGSTTSYPASLSATASPR